MKVGKHSRRFQSVSNERNDERWMRAGWNSEQKGEADQSISLKLDSQMRISASGNSRLECRHITTRRGGLRNLLRVPYVSNETLIGRVHDVLNVVDDLVLDRDLLAHVFGNVLLLAQDFTEHIHSFVLLCGRKDAGG